MGRIQQLIDLLGDGRFRSGSALGKEFGLSRAALWKWVGELRELGVPVEAVRGRGYRLAYPVTPLRPELIVERLAAAGVPPVPVSVELAVPSTNAILLDAARRRESPRALFAELQHAGRGRWGRRWQSAYGAGIYLSLLWNFPPIASGIGGLGLACAISVARRLRALGAAALGLKWPNDLVGPQGKLGGVLCELAGEANGPCAAVIGIGLNVRLPFNAPQFDQPAIDLARLLDGAVPDRNVVAAEVLAGLIECCRTYERQGFAAYEAAWDDYDLLLGQPVRLHLADKSIEGIARGVDSRGALRLEQPGGTMTFFSGDLELRLRRDPAP